MRVDVPIFIPPPDECMASLDWDRDFVPQINVTTNGELRRSWALRGDALQIADERQKCLQLWSKTTQSIVEALQEKK